jgi:hypothetical protein
VLNTPPAASYFKCISSFHCAKEKPSYDPATFNFVNCLVLSIIEIQKVFRETEYLMSLGVGKALSPRYSYSKHTVPNIKQWFYNPDGMKNVVPVNNSHKFSLPHCKHTVSPLQMPAV